MPTPASPDAPRIFVSHSHSDDEFTERLVDDLIRAGAHAWMDKRDLGAGNFQERINEALDGCEWFVLVLTRDALASPWVRQEVDAANRLKNQKRIKELILIQAGPVEHRELPPLWGVFNILDATRDYSGALSRTLKLVGLPPLPLPATPAPHHARPAAPPPPRYPLPDVPARLASLGFRGVNPSGTPAILPPLVSVAAGPFLMGSAESDKEAFDWEKPQHRVELAAFQIGKYPVTVAEYAIAVRAGAVREPPSWRPSTELVKFGWPDRETTWNSQLQHLDHPVVCVSWQDAMAYIAWLRGVTGEAGWRLPSEAQWEKAARWDAPRGVSRIYPWGDSFDQNRCSTSESGAKATTPVGAYPANDARCSGASPWGAEEMAGNVWEWTSSVYKPYPYTENDGREDQKSTKHRVLRGGSWLGDARRARATYRHSYWWDGLDDNWGFRLALARRAGS